jgi:hypothetical protein
MKFEIPKRMVKEEKVDIEQGTMQAQNVDSSPFPWIGNGPRGGLSKPADQPRISRNLIGRENGRRR